MIDHRPQYMVFYSTTIYFLCPKYMTNLDATHFKTGDKVITPAEIHTAVFDVSGTVDVSGSHPYAHITPDTKRFGAAEGNSPASIVIADNKYVTQGNTSARISSRAHHHPTDASFVDFDIVGSGAASDGSYNLLIRPQGGTAVAVSEPINELTTSYTRKGKGTGTEHMLSSAGCLNTYTRTTFNQMFRAEETGTLSKIRFNEDFVDPSSEVSITIHNMSENPSNYYTDASENLLTITAGEATDAFDVIGATDISCVVFDVSASAFNIHQDSLYMLAFNGSFCDMGIWETDPNMSDMSGNGTAYITTVKQPYPMEITVKSTSVSGKSDSGSTIAFASDVSGIFISTTNDYRKIPLIDSIRHTGTTTYDVVVGITDVSDSHPYAPHSEITLMRLDCSGDDIAISDVRKGEYKNDTVATKDQLFAWVGGESTLVMSYFDTSANEFTLMRCAVDDLLHHPTVFDDVSNNKNPWYQDAVGDNTSPGFKERLEAIGPSGNTKLHTVPFDGEPNSGMRMACDASGNVSGSAADGHWVAYTDLRYVTNTDANVYLVNMSAATPNDTLFHIPLRNPLPQADLSYRYFIANFPTLSMCREGDVRHISVGRNVHAYDSRANTITFVSADVSVYRVNTDTHEASYVGTVDMEGTEMPGFSQYVDLSGGVAPRLHYTVTDVSGDAWKAQDLNSSIGGNPIPLNNFHLIQHVVLYDISNSVTGVRWCDVSGSTTTTSSTVFHADVSGNLNVTGDCYANNFISRHTDANSVSVNHSLWANRVEAASISTTSFSIGAVELTADQLERIIDHCIP